MFGKIICTFNHIINSMNLKRQKVEIESDVQINGRVLICNSGKLRICSNSIINSSPQANRAGGWVTRLSVNPGANLMIGRNVGISNATIFAAKEITIEDNVLIGAGTTIYDTDFHPIDYETRIKGMPSKAAAVRICEGAFIGANSIILKGTTIGKHSIVGAGSVVSKSIPDNEIWGGNPAKLIRNRNINIDTNSASSLEV